MRNLWYVRQGEKISGPHPEQLIARYVALGRFKPQDQVSVDQAVWVALEEVPELLPVETELAENEKLPEKQAWREERRRAASRWRDERNLPDRRQGQKDGVVYHGKRSSKDRRQMEESAEILALRQRHAANELRLKKKRERFYATAASLIFMAFAMLVVISVARPVVPVKVGMKVSAANCKQAPGEQVNWAGCDKNGVNLTGANLRSANLITTRMQGAHLTGAHLDYAQLAGADATMATLSQAHLAGANLTGADLTSADLTGADMHFADLRGARLDGAELKGALLGNAVWTDGRVCKPDSVGQCF